MSERSAETVGKVLKSRFECEAEGLVSFYDKWAENYEKDLDILEYQGLNLAAELISSNFSGNRKDAQVLDVGCGPGQLAGLMSERGFMHFVGIDFSKKMLEEAAKTGFYEDLKQAKLGSEPLPAQAGAFDVVAIIGSLKPDLVPFSVLRELCQATKPGGLICITKSQHKTDPEDSTAVVERELQLLVEEGLWTHVETTKSDRYLKDTSMVGDGQDDRFISGRVYLFRKNL